MANQKQSVGRARWREVGPGNSEGGVCAARAPKPRPRGGFLGCQTSAGARGAGCGVPSSVYPASEKGKGEIHFVTELETRLHRPLWVTADSLFLGEPTRRAGEAGKGALLGLGNLTLNSLTPGYT